MKVIWATLFIFEGGCIVFWVVFLSPACLFFSDLTMIVFISTSAILTVLATGLQFVGIFLPTWWRSPFVWVGNKHGYYTYGLWHLPWKTEKCDDGHCTELKNQRIETPTWLIFTRIFELLGAGFGLIIIILMLIWLILLGPMQNKYLKTARKLGLVSSFLQISTGICINVGILILVIKTTPSDILIGTFLSGISFIIFCIGGAISYHCVKQMPSSYDNPETNCADSSLSIISPPAYCDPPPSYEEIMGAHYAADNPSIVVDAEMVEVTSKWTSGVLNVHTWVNRYLNYWIGLHRSSQCIIYQISAWFPFRLLVRIQNFKVALAIWSHLVIPSP